MNLPPAGVGNYLNGLASVDKHEGATFSIAPPFPYIGLLLADIAARSLTIAVGGQNCSDRPSGAFTGEVSASMLQSVGARFVISGHSERRGLFGETDDVVRRKLEMIVGARLVPLLCIGEPLEVRESGATEPHLRRQLDAALAGWNPEGLVVAYEPIWAIGTGRNASGAMVAETGRFIRAEVRRHLERDVPLLYGGSVTDDNVGELVSQGEVDGFLVGGASLDAGKFGRIYAACRLA